MPLSIPRPNQNREWLTSIGLNDAEITAFENAVANESAPPSGFKKIPLGADDGAKHLIVSEDAVFLTTKHLGDGQFGAVEKGFNLSTDSPQPLAIKTINMTRASDEEITTELTVLGRTNQLKGDTDAYHPPEELAQMRENLIKPDKIIASDFIEGQTLERRLFGKEEERTNPKREKQVKNNAYEMGISMLVELRGLNDKGVVHRDFKSANVMVGEDNQCHVIDFGDALYTPTERPLPDNGGWKQDYAVGTPLYNAPELTDPAVFKANGGKLYSKASDAYAGGVVLAEIFSDHDYQPMLSEVTKAGKPITPQLYEASLQQMKGSAAVPEDVRPVIDGLTTKDRSARMNIDDAVVTLQQQYLSRIERDPNVSAEKKSALEKNIAVDYSARQLQKFAQDPENAEFLDQNPEIKEKFDELSSTLASINTAQGFGSNYAKNIDKRVAALNESVEALPKRKFQDQKAQLAEITQHAQTSTPTMRKAATIREGSEQVQNAVNTLDGIKTKDTETADNAARLKALLEGAQQKAENHPENNQKVADKIGEYLAKLDASDDKKSRKAREIVRDSLIESSPAIRNGYARAKSGTMHVDETLLEQLSRAKAELGGEKMSVGAGRGRSMSERWAQSQGHRTASGRDLKRYIDPKDLKGKGVLHSQEKQRSDSTRRTSPLAEKNQGAAEPEKPSRNKLK